MAALMDLTGQRFGRLVVQGISCRRGTRGQVYWDCICACGNIRSVQAANLRNGHILSCGCYAMDALRRRSTTHGGSGTRLFRIWLAMIRRCERVGQDNYQWYGGRGILVHPLWRKSFAEFQAWAIRNGYTDSLSIDRIDNDGNYEPENCRWLPLSENVSRARAAAARKTRALHQTAGDAGRRSHMNG